MVAKKRIVKKNMINNISPQTTWDLTRYFYNGIDSPEFKRDWNSIPKEVDNFCKKYKGKIRKLTPKGFIFFLKERTELNKKAYKIGMYLSYLFALNSQNHEIIRKSSEFEHMMTEQSNKQLFINEEFKKIGSKKLIALSKNPKLKDYSNYFYQKAISLKHMLEEKTEFALNLKEQGGASAFESLYQELTSSFTFKVKINGKIKELTDSEVRSLRLSKDWKLREKALKSIREVYGDKKVQITLGNTYKALVRDWTSDTRLRKYNSVLGIRNRSEELSDNVVNLLLDQVENSYKLYHRYLKAKAKALGNKKIKYRDLYSPLSNKDKKYRFSKALDTYLNIINKFDKQFYDYSVDMFEKGRVDVFPKKGKRGGAFASYEKGFESFVLLNHTDKLTDVRTIAHELGHAIHGHLAQKQKAQVYNNTLSLAETASVFNETLLCESMLPNMSKEEKKGFIAEILEGYFGTIHRQVQYVLFEKKVHEAIISGKDLTYLDFNKMWRKEQEKLMGDAVEYDVPADSENGWSTIPHIHVSPFYCYSYAFGNLLALALYKRYKSTGSKFVPAYKEILSAGGSKMPYPLLKQHGIDITREEFYKQGIEVIKELLEEFEKQV